MNQNTLHAIQPFVGAWRLVSFEARNEEGTVTHPFGADARGSLIYTGSGQFSAQVMRSNRPQFATGDQMQGTPAEIETSYTGCISYFGSYTVDARDGFVVHHVEASLFPNWERTDQKRFFEFFGNRLKLSTPPSTWGGAGRIGIVVWERQLTE